MYVRAANAEDLVLCEALDHSYTTQRVWQLALERRPATAVEEAELIVRIKATRLPRSLLVTLPPLEVPLREAADRYDALWVLAEDVAAPGTIYGYAATHVQPGRCMAELSLINVVPTARRRGAGTLLLQAALRWTRGCGLDGLMAHAPTRAEPGICFYLRHGFHISGYSENFYSNQDIALFFAREF